MSLENWGDNTSETIKKVPVVPVEELIPNIKPINGLPYTNLRSGNEFTDSFVP